MKTLKFTLSNFCILLLFFIFSNSASANNGGLTYKLQIKNFEILQSGAEVQFDVYLLNTTPGGLPYYYASSTYWIWINKNVIPASGIVTGSILAGNTQLGNLTQKPSAVTYNTNSGDPTNRYYFRISGGSSTGIDQSTASLISTAGMDGTLICRVSLVCKVSGTPTPFISDFNSDLDFKLPPAIGGNNNFNSIFAYTLAPPATSFTNMTFSGSGAGASLYTDNAHLGSDAPLPVELSSFTSVINQRTVKLNWSTATEQNNSGFDIERKINASVNNPNDWQKLSFVQGTGNSNQPKSYSFVDRGVSTGKYNYRLKQIDFNGNYKYYSLANEVEIGVPNKYDISQNYPNPFNPTTKINYDLPFDSKVSIKIFDMTGREIYQLVNEPQTAGYYTAQFNGSNLSSGVYFYNIIAEGGNNKFVTTKKMVLVK